MTASRRKRFFVGVLTYGIIIAVTLGIVDLVCIGLGLFPPTHNYGDAELGWRSAAPTGKMAIGRCVHFSTNQTVTYDRNEDGVRTNLSRNQIIADTETIKIGVTGDSQTDLCSTNAELHAGVLESELVAKGLRVAVMSYGSGRYSPLQAYLAFRNVIGPYHPQVLIMNVYTGNDLYDILRVDDRPHFVATDSGYTIAKPVWYTLDDPAVKYRSRVAFAARTIAEKVGIRQIFLRVSQLRKLGAEQNAGLSTVLSYMRDLWKAREPSVWYSDAFTSQMLNQQLFFHYFPASQEESFRRMKALMQLIRKENPGLILVMSPLPSYELSGEKPVDEAFLRTLTRIPVSYEEGIRQESALYERLRALSAEEQWLFVDSWAAIKGYTGKDRLFNDYDYHFLPPGSALIGKAQAAVLADTLSALKR